MKICGIICEYNPFHNGHKYQLGQIREQSGCDGILCIMSGNFTQRGEIALLDKYSRRVVPIEADYKGFDCADEFGLISPVPVFSAPEAAFSTVNALFPRNLLNKFFINLYAMFL